MVTLRYIFWVMALFLMGGCAFSNSAALEYRWDVLAAESAGGNRSNLIFASGPSGQMGLDYANGLLLNQRRVVISEANFPAKTIVSQYSVRYHDNYSGRGGSSLSPWHSVQNYSNVRRNVEILIESDF